MTATELKSLIEGGKAKLERARAEAHALPAGRLRLHLEHLIRGAERGLVELNIELAGMSTNTTHRAAAKEFARFLERPRLEATPRPPTVTTGTSAKVEPAEPPEPQSLNELKL